MVYRKETTVQMVEVTVKPGGRVKIAETARVRMK
jgi:hypothetical protein